MTRGGPISPGGDGFRRGSGDRVRPDGVHPDERRGELAAILARVVIRSHGRAKAAGIIDAQESRPVSENRLERSGETRLSVDTRGLTPRSDGDER